MKTVALLLATFFLAAPFASAQENYGTIKATTKLLMDGSKSTTIVDPDKHTAEETLRDARNKVMRKTVYLLGDNDISVGAIFYDAKDTVIYKASYTRDGFGNVSEAAFSAPDGRYLGKRVFVYAGSKTAQIIDYDANGQLITPAQAAVPKATAVKKRR